MERLAGRVTVGVLMSILGDKGSGVVGRFTVDYLFNSSFVAL